MDAILTEKAERLAKEIATQAKTLDDLNGLVKLMMKSALERMLDTEMDVHLGRKKLPGSSADSPATGASDLRCRTADQAGGEEPSQRTFT